MSLSGASLRLKNTLLIPGVALLTFVCDFVSKQWALASLNQGVLVKFVAYLLGLTLVTNTGTAFGMWRGVPIVGLLVPPLICAGIIYFIVKREMSASPLHTVERIGFGLVLGGAAGNVVDRLMHGKVTDFIYFEFYKSFPVFNVADALIDVGVVLVILHVLFTKDDSQKGGAP